MSGSGEASMKLLVVAPSDEDKSNFMGALVYRTGLDLQLMERLEKAHKARYDQIVPFMRAERLEPSFHTPRHHCTFVEDTNVAETIMFLLNVTMSISDAVGILQNGDIKKALSGGAKAIVAVDRMEDANWAAQPYQDLVNGFEAAFKLDHAATKEIRFVPTSSVSGDNILDLSTKSPWYSQRSTVSGGVKLPQTVVEAIDS